VWQVAYHRLHSLFGFGAERVIGQVMGVEVGFDGLETLVPFLMLRNSKFTLTRLFSYFCN
jgi:hypothetical protein